MTSAVQKKQESQNEGEKMIDSLILKNFRCFETANLEKLQTVNVIVGRNSSGKTALLEGLFLTLGGASLAFKIKGWRGLGSRVQYTEMPESRNAIWRDLFFKFDQQRTAVAEIKGTLPHKRRLEITCTNEESYIVKKMVISKQPPIVFEYFQDNNRIGVVKPEFSGEEVKLEGSPVPLNGAFFPSNHPVDPAEAAINFSNLSRKQEAQEVIELLRSLYPSVLDLSLELNSGYPMVYATLKGVQEKMPLGLVSTGITKAFSYIVSIANQRGGVVIIDEIENGFYWDTMEDVWNALFRFCDKYNAQLFASTHSLECLQAVASVAKGREERFSLIKAVNEGDKCSVYQSTGLNFRRAIDQHMEIR